MTFSKEKLNSEIITELSDMSTYEFSKSIFLVTLLKQLGHIKDMFTPYGKSKGAADQPELPHSLIRAFSNCCLDSIIYHKRTTTPDSSNL